MPKIRREPEVLRAELADHPSLRRLAGLLKEGELIWLVGGALRDGLLGLAVADFDFTLPGDPTPLAKRLADLLGGCWFMLDESRRQSRVVEGKGPEALTFDFAPFRGPDLEADLAGRDFTVNALAMPLGPEGFASLRDPLDGLRDLEEGRLRCCGAGVLEEDPLRVLKGIRHLAHIGLEPEEATRLLMVQAAPGLDQIPGERIGREVALLFRVPEAPRGLGLLVACGAGARVFGTVPGSPRVEAAFERLRTLDRTAGRLLEEEAAPGLWEETLQGDWTRGSLIRLAAWLRGFRVSEASIVASRLSLGRRTARVLDSLLQLSPAKAVEAAAVTPYHRSRALWAEDLGPDPVAALFLLMALHPKQEPRGLREILRSYLNLRREGGIRPLLDGGRVQDLLGRRAGPEIGSLLERLRRAEIEGRVKSPREAENFLKSLLKKEIDRDGDGSYNQGRTRE